MLAVVGLSIRSIEAAAVSSGEVIKFSHEPTVYYVNHDLVLEPYYSEHGFFSWDHYFNEVRVLDADLAVEFARGRWQSIKPGSLIKTAIDPKVYLVTDFFQARHLTDEAVAMKTVGLNWQAKILTLATDELALYRLFDDSAKVDRRTRFTAPEQKYNASTAKAIVFAGNYLKAQPLTWWQVIALSGVGKIADSPSMLIEGSLTGLAKTIIGLVAVGINPDGYYQRNLPAEIKHAVRQNQLGDPRLLNDDVWGMLALRAAGFTADDPVISGSADYLQLHQNSDGGWSHMIGQPSDTNDTAMTLIALLEAELDVDNQSVVNGFNFLEHSQSSDGGYGFFSNSSSDTASTAWVMSALYRAGRTVPRITLEYLLNNQQADGGFGADHVITESDTLSTAFALVALAKEYYQPNHD